MSKNLSKILTFAAGATLAVLVIRGAFRDNPSIEQALRKQLKNYLGVTQDVLNVAQDVFSGSQTLGDSVSNQRAQHVLEARTYNLAAYESEWDEHV
ncbi:MAG: hypothetical protein FWG00_02060 [Coriobacteriia bacterium]|nr:hypothetical protein [Coriobacteriia bacterium]